MGANLEIVGGFFLAGLLLWWIIKSDMKQMAFQERMRAENAKRDARAKQDRNEALAIHRSGRAYAVRRDRHLQWLRDQCAKAQDSRALIPVATVANLFGWEGIRNFDGEVEYREYYGMVCAGNEVYASSNEEKPFPEQSTGAFRASDLVSWIETTRAACDVGNEDWLGKNWNSVDWDAERSYDEWLIKQ
ncbi:hypothetical protein SAMN05443247_06633 [Bradyrhizobium erythrophlei]|nr:hypothetical protein SAMN05443247_06633 [Bradyrhizobium erythrophlei]